MVLVEAAFVFGLVGVMIYGITMLLLRAGEQRRPSPRSGTWRVVHYDARGQTHVVLQRVPEGGTRVLDEHVVATFPADEPEYDARFLAAMDTARQRQALFEAEDRA